MDDDDDTPAPVVEPALMRRLPWLVIALAILLGFYVWFLEFFYPHAAR